MGPELNVEFEKLAHSLNIAYELIEKIAACEKIKEMTSMLTSQSQTQVIIRETNKYIQNRVVGNLKYKDAISILETEFGNVPSVQDALKKVYKAYPALKS